MPELPEVETVARGLQTSIAGRRILAVHLRKTDFIDDPSLIERELPGARIEKVERYGKFMLLRLAEAASSSLTAESRDAFAADRALLVHLGMTGHLAPSAAEVPLAKHTHASFRLDDGRELRYTDARRFGRMAYLSGEALAAELRRFGAEPLQVSREEFAARIHGSKACIKALLLDQSVLRGVGNIYADESLWRAKIHPATPGARLTPKQAERLRVALQKILLRAISMNGSTISDFMDADGRWGSYQQHHRVYGREGKRCHRCAVRVRRIIVAGRGSHFCPVCQPAPRRKARSTKKAKRKGPRKTSKS